MRSCSAASAEMFGEVVRRIRPFQKQRQPPHVRQRARDRWQPSARPVATLRRVPPPVRVFDTSATKHRPQPQRMSHKPQPPRVRKPRTHSRRPPLSIHITPVIICDNTHKAKPPAAQPVPQRSAERTNARPHTRNAGQARRQPPPRPYFLRVCQPAVYPDPFRKS